MMRLSSQDRLDITNKAMAHRFTEEASKLRDDWAKFAIKMYNKVYSPADRKLMASLPSGWLPMSMHIGINFTGNNFARLYFDGHSNILQESRTLLKEDRKKATYPLADKHHNTCACSMKDQDSGVEYMALKHRTDTLENSVKDARLRLTAALASVSSLNRLLELWPEMKPFCKDVERRGNRLLPALPTKELNVLLDLPVE